MESFQGRGHNSSRNTSQRFQVTKRIGNPRFTIWLINLAKYRRRDRHGIYAYIPTSLLLNSECVFCRIVSGKLSSRIIVREEKAIAFLDAYPLARGHALVIPDIHVTKVQDLPEGHGFALFQLLRRIVGPIEKVARVNASTIAVHNGKEAGQEISHLHVHIIPRNALDGAGPVHSMFVNRPQISLADMDEIVTNIRELLQT